LCNISILRDRIWRQLSSRVLIWSAYMDAPTGRWVWLIRCALWNLLSSPLLDHQDCVYSSVIVLYLLQSECWVSSSKTASTTTSSATTYVCCWPFIEYNGRNSSSARHSAHSYTFICSVVCLSVCLSHSCTLLESFDGFRCHLVRTLMGSNDTRHGVRWCLAPGEGEGGWGRTPQPKHAIANCSCHRANRNDKRFRIFPNYFGLVGHMSKFRAAGWGGHQRRVPLRNHFYRY